MSKGLDDVTINNARNTYLNAAIEMVQQLSSRVETPFFNTYPDDTNDDSIIFTIAS